MKHTEELCGEKLFKVFTWGDRGHLEQIPNAMPLLVHTCSITITERGAITKTISNLTEVWSPYNR